MATTNHQTINQRVLAVLPPARAKQWMSPAVMRARDPSLRTRSLYATLNYMRITDAVVRRIGETGRWEYARPAKNAR